MARGFRIGYPRAYRIAADGNTYSVSGQSIILNKGFTLTAAQGSYAVAGQAAALSTTASVNFAWDANPAGDGVTNYVLYYGTISGVYTNSINVGNVTSHSIASPGSARFYALTAQNSSGESAFSNELFR